MLRNCRRWLRQFFAGDDIHLSYLPEFRAKTESKAKPLPRSFVVRSLKDFVGSMEDELVLSGSCSENLP